MADPDQLDRFVDAQNLNGMYERAVSELRAGRKVSHWMWYIFPQIAGLGSSPMSQRFAICSITEAQAYLQHPILGPRLTMCAQVVMGIDAKSATEIFGEIDAMKLRSSMTLFMSAAPDESIFRAVLDKFFNGSPDASTIGRL
jgi:uncharacterized protein (DUF1810 family)